MLNSSGDLALDLTANFDRYRSIGFFCNLYELAQTESHICLDLAFLLDQGSPMQGPSYLPLLLSFL